MDVAGAKILVTGASSGIGAALAPMLAARGATVGIVARRAERLDAVLERCRTHAPGSRRWVVDLADLDGVVHNAAIPKRIPVDRLTPELVDETMRVNFTAPVRMTMALLPRMLERGRGQHVFVSSMGGRIGIAHEAAYCASKFALCGWSESMRIDLHGTGVETKLVLPGPIATEIWDLPGNDAPIYDGPFVPAEECATTIVEAIENDGFEYYAPPDFPGGMGRQVDLVVGKTGAVDAFVDGMGASLAGPGG
jgi:short-subunit dehydrogenase